jgi:hypothetical protein
MASRIRRGTLTVGSGVPNLANVDWQDNREFDRSKGDEEMSGTPVEMSRGGSGTITLLAGAISSGYATSNVVVRYNQVSVANGVETVVQKTVTFTGVTFNQGGTVPAEGRGEKKISFDYSTSTEA